MKHSDKTTPSTDETPTKTAPTKKTDLPVDAPADLDIQISLFGKSIISARAFSGHQIRMGSVREFTGNTKDSE